MLDYLMYTITHKEFSGQVLKPLNTYIILQRIIMNFALVSLNDANYQPLADFTWAQNKIEYAERHGYSYACKNSHFYGVVIGYEKIFFIRDMMVNYPDIDWFWWTGCDTLITNLTIKLEDRVDNDYHFIIAKDCNGINADSFLVRNSLEGRGFIDSLISKYDQYKDHHWAEQQAIIDSQEEYHGIIKIVPQRDINAYEYSLYPDCTPIDQNGNDGQWKQGDLLIHWPGRSLWDRMHLTQHYMTQVIK
jgi:mannan polymerase II complex MNN10 subunit